MSKITTIRTIDRIKEAHDELYEKYARPVSCLMSESTKKLIEYAIRTSLGFDNTEWYIRNLFLGMTITIVPLPACAVILSCNDSDIAGKNAVRIIEI